MYTNPSRSLCRSTTAPYQYTTLTTGSTAYYCATNTKLTLYSYITSGSWQHTILYPEALISISGIAVSKSSDNEIICTGPFVENGIAGIILDATDGSYKDTYINLYTQSLPSGAMTVSNGADFSYDSQKIAIGFSSSPYLLVVNKSDSSKITLGSLPTSQPYGLIFSHSPGSFLAATVANAPYLVVYTTSNWQTVTLTGGSPAGAPTWAVTPGEFSPNNQYLAIISTSSAYFVVYDTSTWNKVTLGYNPPTYPYSISFSVSSVYCAICYTGSPYFKVYTTSDWNVVSGTPIISGLNSVKFLPDNQKILLSTPTIFYIYNISDWSLNYTSSSQPGGISDFRHNAWYLGYNSNVIYARLNNGTVYEAWEISSWRLLYQKRCLIPTLNFNDSRCFVDPQHEKIYLKNASGSFVLLNLKTLKNYGSLIPTPSANSVFEKDSNGLYAYFPGFTTVNPYYFEISNPKNISPKEFKPRNSNRSLIIHNHSSYVVLLGNSSIYGAMVCSKSSNFARNGDAFKLGHSEVTKSIIFSSDNSKVFFVQPNYYPHICCYSTSNYTPIDHNLNDINPTSLIENSFGAFSSSDTYIHVTTVSSSITTFVTSTGASNSIQFFGENSGLDGVLNYFIKNDSIGYYVLNNSKIYNISNHFFIKDLSDISSGTWTNTIFNTNGTVLATRSNASPYVLITNTSDWSVINVSNLTQISYSILRFSGSTDKYLALTSTTAPYLNVVATSNWTQISGISANSNSNTDNRAYFYNSENNLIYSHSSSPYFTVYNTSDWSTVTITGGLPTATSNNPCISNNTNYYIHCTSASPYFTVYKTSDWTKSTITGGAPPGSISARNLVFDPNDVFFACGGTVSPYLAAYTVSNWTKVTLGSNPVGVTFGITFSPNGSYLAYITTTSPYLELYRTSNWTKITLGSVPYGYQGKLTFSPDSTLLVYSSYSTSTSTYVIVYNTSDGSTVSVNSRGYLSAGQVLAADFIDANNYVTASYNAYATRYTTSNWTLVDDYVSSRKFTTDAMEVYFYPTRNISVVKNISISPYIRAFSTTSYSSYFPKINLIGKQPEYSNGTNVAVPNYPLGYDPSENYLTVGLSASPYVYIWALSNWSKVSDPSSGPTSTVKSGVFSSSGTWYAACFSSSPYVLVVDTTNWNSWTSTPSSPSSINHMAASNTFLVCAYTASPYLYIYNKSTSSTVSTPSYVPNTLPTALAFNSDGSKLIVSLNNPGIGNLIIYNTSDWSVYDHGVATLLPKDTANSSSYYSRGGAFYGTNKFVMVLSKSPYIYLFDTSTSPWSRTTFSGTVLPTGPSGYSEYPNVKLSPNEQYLAICLSASPYLSIYNTSNWSLVDLSSITISQRIGYLRFTPDSAKLMYLTTATTYFVYVINTSTWSSENFLQSGDANFDRYFSFMFTGS
jgi:hypothetical protein